MAEQATSGAAAFAVVEPFSRKLKIWFWVFLPLWFAGMALIVTADDRLVNGRAVNNNGGWGALLLAASVVPYIMCIIQSYRIQKRLYERKLYKHSGVAVIVAAIILNPCTIGFAIPLHVMLTVSRIKKGLQS